MDDGDEEDVEDTEEVLLADGTESDKGAEEIVGSIVETHSLSTSIVIIGSKEGSILSLPRFMVIVGPKENGLTDGEEDGDEGVDIDGLGVKELVEVEVDDGDEEGVEDTEEVLLADGIDKGNDVDETVTDTLGDIAGTAVFKGSPNTFPSTKSANISSVAITSPSTSISAITEEIGDADNVSNEVEGEDSIADEEELGDISTDVMEEVTGIAVANRPDISPSSDKSANGSVLFIGSPTSNAIVGVGKPVGETYTISDDVGVADNVCVGDITEVGDGVTFAVSDAEGKAVIVKVGLKVEDMLGSIVMEGNGEVGGIVAKLGIGSSDISSMKGSSDSMGLAMT